MDAATLTAWALVITAIGSFVASAGSVYNIYLTRRAAVKLDEHGEKLAKVEEHTNGLTKALGEAKLAQGTAEGTAVGLQRGRDEAAETS